MRESYRSCWGVQIGECESGGGGGGVLQTEPLNPINPFPCFPVKKASVSRRKIKNPVSPRSRERVKLEIYEENWILFLLGFMKIDSLKVQCTLMMYLVCVVCELWSEAERRYCPMGVLMFVCSEFWFMEFVNFS